MAVLDHLVYAGPNLAEAVDEFERLTGIRAGAGGPHVGRGTANHLVSFGPGSAYLEIIGPDPDQPDPSEPRAFGIDTLSGPKLVTFAIRPDETETFEAVIGTIRAAGFSPGPIRAMRRTRADGVELDWQLTSHRLLDDGELPDGGLVPFVIDWGATPHPTESATPGLSMTSMRVAGGETTAIYEMYDRLGLDIQVDRGETSITCRLVGPKTVDLT